MVDFVVSVGYGPVPGDLEGGGDVADGARVGAESVDAGVGVVAALEIPADDPMIEDPAIRAGQHQVGGLGPGQPADVLAGLDVDIRAGVFPAYVVRHRLGHDPDAADPHPARDSGPDHVGEV